MIVNIYQQVRKYSRTSKGCYNDRMSEMINYDAGKVLTYKAVNDHFNLPFLAIRKLSIKKLLKGEAF